MGLFKRQMQSTGLCRLDNCNNSERSSRRFIKTNEAPYQTIGQRTLASTLGFRELTSRHFWLSVLSESISCYLYVFIVCSTRISWTGSVIGHEPNLIAMALSSGIAMMLLILTFRTVHVNPALTLAFLMTGRIPVVRAIVYVLVHCMSAAAAIALLYSISIAGHAGALGLDNPHPLLESWQVLIIEFVISFVVTIVTYSTCSYSSYTSARQYILDQVAQNCSDLLDLKSPACDSEHETTNGFGPGGPFHQKPNGCLMNSSTMHQTQRSTASTLATGPRRPMSTNFRVHPQTKNYLSDTYENSDYEYEYDNHRIYSNQPISSSEVSPASRGPPIEESMHDECQLLAPNGFSLQMSPGQSFIIGLAYAITSMTGIPGSGASLNPARSFGPAFIMNRWDNHWIYWTGPVAGAIFAGLLYEFVFNPTRSVSMCYRPKLFRLSAHDMAKVGSRSRLYQQSQKLSAPSATATNVFPSMTDHRPQVPHISTIHNSPSLRHPVMQASNNLMSTATIQPPRENQLHQPLIATSTSLAHLQSNQFAPSKQDQMNYFHQQQQQQQYNNHFAGEAANFDHRSKSTAIINALASKQHQTTIHPTTFNPQRNNFHSNSSSNASNSQDFSKFSTQGFRGYPDQSMPFGTSKPAFSEL